MSYYNTTKESVEAVKKYRKINNGQDKKVLKVIKDQKKPFSTSLIYLKYKHGYFEYNTPITSIRRSITTIKNIPNSPIEETGKRVQGLYGRSELQYRLTNNVLKSTDN